MKDITAEMLEFKEAVRHIWNGHFAQRPSRMSGEMQDAFSQIERGLFGAIVLSSVDVDQRAAEYREQPLSWLILEPASELTEWPVQFGVMEDNGNTTWQPPSLLDVKEEMIFEFFDFFDWNAFGFVDLPYVRARVKSAKAKPSQSIALVEQRLCRFMVRDSADT